MIELRATLQHFLKTIHPRVYYQEASEKTAYPYIVYSFSPITSDGEGFETGLVDIDGWDCNNTGDITVIENLMKSINGNSDLLQPTGLDKQTLITDDITGTFYLESKLSPIENDDKRIKRVRYTYQFKLFRRS